MESPIRYMIADDHTLFREGLRLVLGNYPHLLLTGEAANGQELLKRMGFAQPDVVLLDLTMPVMDGLETTQKIREQFPAVRILILTMNDDPNLIIHLLELGANGYLLKNADSSEIALALRACAENGYYFSDYVSSLMLKSMVQKTTVKPVFAKEAVFNEREKEVLRLICEGLTAAQIGKTIFLSPRTVEGIRAGLMEKTGTHNVAGLVMYAVKKGIVM